MHRAVAHWREYGQHLGVWCRRFGHRRCWRIHSPSAYQFVRRVLFASPMAVDKPWLIKARHTARQHYADHTWQRYHRLVYRLACYQVEQVAVDVPLHWAIVTPDGQSSLLPYLEAAAQRWAGRQIHVEAYTPERLLAAAESPSLLCVDLADLLECERILWPALAAAQPHSLLFVRHIYHTPACYALWQRIEHHAQAVVTYDAYYWGLVCFGQGLSKEAHKLCF